MYEDFASIIEGKKYNFISIDGPWGSKDYSRIDIIDYIPAILEDEFIIMLDDFQRKGEQNMIELLKEKLDNYNIHYHMGKYSGVKDICVIVSDNWKFICTM